MSENENTIGVLSQMYSIRVEWSSRAVIAYHHSCHRPTQKYVARYSYDANVTIVVMMRTLCTVLRFGVGDPIARTS